ncbi:Carbonic anhydrase [Phycisphaerae bacterium RAS1]|nr:Carbonic anhydrase [Phycisphaerae bacterium RAS1]
MQKLVQGVHSFQSEVFGSQRRFFERLAEGQNPLALFITCSDSRINPNLITQTAPGELFILRNAGNIVPPYGVAASGETATIEFAVAGLGVRDIIVCGHSHCGAMKGLLEPEILANMPSMKSWLAHAEATRRIVAENYSHYQNGARLTVAVEENVLVQLENLRTHPAVASALARKALQLHGWVYKLESGQVFSFNPAEQQFLPLTDSAASDSAALPALTPGRLI